MFWSSGEPKEEVSVIIIAKTGSEMTPEPNAWPKSVRTVWTMKYSKLVWIYTYDFELWKTIETKHSCVLVHSSVSWSKYRDKQTKKQAI